MTSFIPETAPFDEQQRAWLSGFFAGLMGLSAEERSAVAQGGMILGSSAGHSVPESPENASEEFPWHDPALPLEERMELAKQAPIERKLMAAMAQLNCGSCGYECKSYAEAIATGTEKNLALCTPGGRETKQMIKLLLKDGREAGKPGSAPTKKNGFAAKSVTSNAYDRHHPFRASLLDVTQLSKHGSAKDVRHIVVDLSGSELKYEVGDALGVYPVNCNELAGKIVTRLGAEPSTRVQTPSGIEKTLLAALCEDYCLRDASDAMMELLAARIDDKPAKETLERMLADGTPVGFDVLDAWDLASQATVTATEVVETLLPLSPRLYSIASSMRKVGSQVHLTVGKVLYEKDGRLRKGTASSMLTERLQPGDRLRVFIQPNHGGFRVPKDDNAPMIMVGPGTGIAPFMAFLQEREARRAAGRNWLFFGDQHRVCDFLYEQELQSYMQSGLLTRLDTAFSRDSEKKVYVQNRMLENASELWSWLNDGGHFYVCGDAQRMATDVERTLLEIISEQGKMDGVAAKSYLKTLAASGRYVRDVY